MCAHEENNHLELLVMQKRPPRSHQRLGEGSWRDFSK